MMQDSLTDKIKDSVEAYRLRTGWRPEIRGALIDMDGTLYDSMKYHAAAWQRMISELGIPCTRDEFFLYEGMTGHATINLIFQREYGRDASAGEARELYALKAQYFVESGCKEPMPGAARMLRTMQDGGVARVLVTGSAQSSLIGRLDDDFPGAFLPDMRVTALDVTHGKPSPEPYLKGLAKAGLKPWQAIVIENAPLGVESGVAAGCYTVAVTTGPIPADEMIKAGADILFESMNAFADALPEMLEIFNEEKER